MKIINLIFISLLISFAKPSVRLISPHLLINRDYFNDSSSPILKSETLFRYLEDVQGSNYANLKTVRLYGDSTLGYYYINLFFGSNYHKASLIVDTGSTITAIPCRSCGNNCGKHHFNAFYDPSTSSTFQEMKIGETMGNYHCNGRDCSFGISYTEGSSYSGYYIKDFISFGNELEDSPTPLNASRIETDLAQNKIYSSFGCITRETKLFYEQQADGILGLGIATDVWDHPPTFIQRQHSENQNISSAFSICYALNGGYLTVGGYNLAYHDPNSKPAYVPFHTEHGQYRVKLRKIQFEGNDLEIDEHTLNYGQGAFFDSGTTLMYTVHETYNKMMNGFNSFCNKEGNCGPRTNDNCFTHDPSKYSLSQFLAKFPTFTFFFGENETYPYELRGEDYLYEQYPGSHKYCIGIDVFGDRTILGGTFMRNHDILFDKEKGIVGFVRSNCSAVSHLTIPDIIPGTVNSSGYTNENVPVYWPPSKKADDKSWLIKLLAVIAISGALLVLYMCLKSTGEQNPNKQVYDEVIPSRLDESSAIVNSPQIEIHEESGADEDLEGQKESDSTAQTFN